MSTLDAVASIVIVVAGAALIYAGKQYLWPDKRSAEELGYMPDSEAPECGWPLAILGTIAVIAIFIGLFGYVGSAVFLG